MKITFHKETEKQATLLGELLFFLVKDTYL